MLTKLSASHISWIFALIAIASMTTIIVGCSKTEDSILTENEESGERGKSTATPKFLNTHVF